MFTIPVSATLDWARTFPSLTPVLSNPTAGYGGNAVPIRLANKVAQDVMAEGFAWKWNRRVPAPFVINQLQQDYSTSITDLGWLENCTRTQINYPEFAPPSAPNYMVRGLEVVRELMQTSVMGIPGQICWLPNSEALAGSWAAGTVFVDPSLGTSLPVQPWMQIRDSNGNIQVLTTFGTTGTEPPAWNTAANGTTADGSCVWTMADPNGITWRLSPAPQQSGIVYQIQPYYQKKPPTIASIGAFWPIPDEMSSVYEQGFLAYARHATEDDAKFEKEFLLFQAKIQKFLVSNDREQESFGFYPSRSLTGVVGNISRGDAQWPPELFLP